MARRYVEVEYEDFIRETANAGLFLIDGEEHWIPWSQIEDGQEFTVGEEGTLFLTKWIADQKEIEYFEE